MELTSKNMEMERYAITLGETAILHTGLEEIGNGRREKGYTVEELQELANTYKNAEYIDLTNKDEKAGLLIIRDGANMILGDDDAANKLFLEQTGIEYDKMYYDNRRKRMLNKRARYNIVLSNNIEQQQCFKRNGEIVDRKTVTSKDFKIQDDDVLFSIANFNKLPYLNKLRRTRTTRTRTSNRYYTYGRL